MSNIYIICFIFSIQQQTNSEEINGKDVNGKDVNGKKVNGKENGKEINAEDIYYEETNYDGIQMRNRMVRRNRKNVTKAVGRRTRGRVIFFYKHIDYLLLYRLLLYMILYRIIIFESKGRILPIILKTSKMFSKYINYKYHIYM